MTGPKIATLMALQEAQAAGMTRQQAASHAGVSRSTVLKYQALFGLVFAGAAPCFNPLLLDVLREASAAGLTRQEAADKAGVTGATVHNYANRYGLTFIKHGRRTPADSDRDRAMAASYRTGCPMKQIGQQYGITHERVRQLLAKYQGITGKDSLHHVRAKRRQELACAERDAKSIAKWGCSFSQWKALSAGSRSPSRAFSQQCKNAHQRDIGWSLTLWQWWSIWQASGKWAQRGRSHYGMYRFADAGPFTVNNVYIGTPSDHAAHLIAASTVIQAEAAA